MVKASKEISLIDFKAFKKLASRTPITAVLAVLLIAAAYYPLDLARLAK